MQADERDYLIDRREVERRFGLNVRFLELAALKGNGPPMIKVSRRVFYRVGDIRDWIDSKKVASTSDKGQR